MPAMKLPGRGTAPAGSQAQIPRFVVCPVCTTRLRQSCTSCNAPLEAIWQACPYCATPIPNGLGVSDDVLQPLRSTGKRRS